MLRNKRKPIFKRYKTEDTNKTDVLMFDDLGFYSEEDLIDPMIFPPDLLPGLNPGQIPEQLNISTQELSNIPMMSNSDFIGTILRDLGITKTSELYMFDTSTVRHFTHEIGKRTTIENKQSMLAMLDIAELLDVKMTDETLAVSDFMYFPESDRWYNLQCDGDVGDIQIIGHEEKEGLYCPMCEEVYTDLSSIVLAQTVSVNPYTLAPTPNTDDLIKIMRPYVSLTPVCPNCYCKKTLDTWGEREKKNVSPMFIGNDTSRGLVPLIPTCFADKLNTEENALCKFTNTLYWPNNDLDGICSSRITEIQEITRKTLDKEENRKTKKPARKKPGPKKGDKKK